MLKESGTATMETTLRNASPCMAKAMCMHGATTKAMAKEDAFYVAMKTFTAFLKSVQEASTRSTKRRRITQFSSTTWVEWTPK